MRDPDQQTGNRRAWAIPLNQEQEHATLQAYLIDYPGAHPFWRWWLVLAIHLRPIGRLGPANIRVPGATHEFMIAAHNPVYPDPDPDLPNQFHHLLPIDLVHQTKATDEEAIEVVDLMVHAIIEGGESPNQDNRSWWERAIEETLEQQRGGHHH